MKTAKEYWKEKFDEYPQTSTDKLAVVMMQEYVEYRVKNNDLSSDISGRFCVFCGEICKDAPTDRGWTDIIKDGSHQGLHFDCAIKVVNNANIINKIENKNNC